MVKKFKVSNKTKGVILEKKKRKHSRLFILKNYLDERLEIKLLILSQFLLLFPVWLHYKAVSTICLWIFLLLCPWCFYEISLGPEFAEQSYLPRNQWV